VDKYTGTTIAAKPLCHMYAKIIKNPKNGFVAGTIHHKNIQNHLAIRTITNHTSTGIRRTCMIVGKINVMI